MKAFFFVHLAINCATPSLAMFVLYSRVICALRKQDEALAAQGDAQRLRTRTRRKVIKIIIMVTLVFYVCCAIPQVLYSAGYLNNIFATKFGLFVDIFIILLGINSAFNPFVYFIFIKSFRSSFRKMLSCKKKHNNVDQHLGIFSQRSRSPRHYKAQRRNNVQPELLELRVISK